jgi:hypothetical protein
MESNGNPLGSNRIPWESNGIQWNPMGIQWNSMGSNVKSENRGEIPGILRSVLASGRGEGESENRKRDPEARFPGYCVRFSPRAGAKAKAKTESEIRRRDSLDIAFGSRLWQGRRRKRKQEAKSGGEIPWILRSVLASGRGESESENRKRNPGARFPGYCVRFSPPAGAKAKAKTGTENRTQCRQGTMFSVLAFGAEAKSKAKAITENRTENLTRSLQGAMFSVLACQRKRNQKRNQ